MAHLFIINHAHAAPSALHIFPLPVSFSGEARHFFLASLLAFCFRVFLLQPASLPHSYAQYGCGPSFFGLANVLFFLYLLLSSSGESVSFHITQFSRLSVLAF